MIFPNYILIFINFDIYMKLYLIFLSFFNYYSYLFHKEDLKGIFNIISKKNIYFELSIRNI